ncbi:hypothetical protein D0T49_06445 [Paludibacter sp. 221]|uniref:DUF7935 family protein n=1 Tax=Paludibacter sp. 221 TaxID=2302939 RepID=UPI0013D3A7E0|nr:hypothetical protein [Paludibacter sp. 221]NDV46683.1 hypothetical protein [Paludibacter sp. 221]
MEILNIAIPAVIVFLTAYLLLDKMFKNEQERRDFELRKNNQSTIVPVRLRAYERLSLFLERTMPNAMLINNIKPDMNCMQLQGKLLETIREEYSHNLSQQIYVSDGLWVSVVAAKESLIKLVNTCAASCNPAEPATVLAEKIIQVFSSSENTPSEIALANLKEEIRKFL